MTLPTFEDLFQAGKFEALRKPTRFAPEVIDTDGSDVNVVVGVSAAMSDEVSGFTQQAFNETHLSTSILAGGEVLDRYVWDQYQIVRFGAEQSVATLAISRPSALSPVSIPAGSVIATEDGQTFETVNEAVMGTGVIGPVSVFAFSQTTGVESNVDKNTIKVKVTQFTDPDLTFTNPEPAAGGLPEETDDELGQRARDFFINARRGTRRAIQNGCVTTPGVAQATVTEFLSVEGNPNFRVQAIISDSKGQANNALATRVKDRLEEFRALGVPVIVVAGNPQFVEIVVEGITFESGANTTVIIDQIRGQVVSAVNQLAPGEVLQVSLIMTALRLNRLVRVPDTAIVSPVGDLFPSSGSGVIRTTSSRVSINGLTGGT